MKIVWMCGVKKGGFLFFMVFLGGVLCANILGIAAGREMGAMNEYFINRYMYADLHGRELFPYLFYKRIPEFVLLFLLSIGIYKTSVADAYIGFLGFSVGFLSVTAIIYYGIKGLLLIAGFFLPQWIFYAPMLFLWRYELLYYKKWGKESPPKSGKRHIKLAVSILLALLLLLGGLFMESYVNPFFLQKIIRITG